MWLYQGEREGERDKWTDGHFNRQTIRYKRQRHRQAVVTVQELCKSRGGRPGLSVLTSLMVSVDVKQYWTTLTHWSQFVPNMSSDIRGHETLHHHHQAVARDKQTNRRTEGWAGCPRDTQRDRDNVDTFCVFGGMCPPTMLDFRFALLTARFNTFQTLNLCPSLPGGDKGAWPGVPVTVRVER